MEHKANDAIRTDTKILMPRMSLMKMMRTKKKMRMTRRLRKRVRYATLCGIYFYPLV